MVQAELQHGASRGVQVTYKFPWGSEPLETLWNLGDSGLLRTHGNAKAKLQVRQVTGAIRHWMVKADYCNRIGL